VEERYDRGVRIFTLLSVVFLSCGRDDTPSGPNGGSSSGGSTTPTTATGSTAHELCVNIINEYRAEDGLPPYTRWAEGETCADGQAKSDADTNDPHGAFGRCKESGQNECPGRPGPPEKMIEGCLAAMWAQGPGEGHHDMMASTKWKSVACGFHTTAKGSVWSVQNYR
jgi:hypothetical protein